MYKLVIADDDEILLKGLTEKIAWDKFGIQVVASVDNGVSALNEVKKYNADILLTDIRMPGMNGIELISHVKQYDQSISVIIISAHDEFEYAREAIKKGADDYLLKPINIELLEETLLRILLEKDNHNAIKSKLNQVDALQLEKIDYNRFKMFYDLLLEALPHDAFYSKYLHLLPHEEYRYFISIVIRFQNIKKEDELIQLQRLNSEAAKIKDQMMFDEMVILGIHRCLIVIDFAKTKEALNTRINQLKNSFKAYMETTDKNAKLAFQSGPIVQSFFQLNESYKEALQVGELYYANDHVIDFDYIETRFNLTETEEVLRELTNKIVHLTIMGNGDALQNCLPIFEENIRCYGKKAKMILSHTLSILFSLIFEECEKIGIEMDSIFKNNVATINQVLSQEKLKDSIVVLSEKLNEVVSYVNTQDNHVNKQLMIKAYKYIEENFDKPEFRLADVANHVGFSKNHFSNVFKTVSNKSFTDYLRDYRMEMAEKLLSSTNLKGYEVSIKVGYDNPTYFSSTFKKHTGFSPSEFKKENNKK
jgi:two-component system response regulator YesN